ncbi:phosphatase PAP2 family protein [Cryomorphaceae bacterium 1068]|nr:phosphatase PAP2 family protein [Cryomorphaceae bacterium 1068]
MKNLLSKAKRQAFVTAFLLCSCSQLMWAQSAVEDSTRQYAYEIPSVDERRAEFRRSLIAPAAFFVAGGIAFTDNPIWSDDAWEDARNRNFPDFRTTADDYLAFAPIVAAYGLELAGVKGAHSLRDRSAILFKAELIAVAIVTPLKLGTNRVRPNGDNDESFPSGHTAQAFISATFLHREYGHLSPWYSIGGYAVAGSVGVLRILNNKHYLSDVLFGAGIGLLATNLAYLTHGYKRTKRIEGLTIMPTYNEGTVGVFAGLRF